jgi:hypothetical protein
MAMSLLSSTSALCIITFLFDHSGVEAAAAPPQQSQLLRAARVAPPPQVAGRASVDQLITAMEYLRDMERRKLQDIPTAASTDIAFAKVCLV